LIDYLLSTNPGFIVLENYFQQKNEQNFHLPVVALPPPPKEIFLPEDPLIEFKNVSVQYGDSKILNGINWRKITGIFGS
jgi:ABC-type molybdenum transport system ATPase subunit/photorepair protein PhrA